MTLAALLISEPSEVFLATLSIVGGSLMVWKLLGPLFHAFARRLEGKTGAAANSAELADLRQRVQELEMQQGRVLELEERVDFAERLLARNHDPARLPAGGEDR